MDRMLAQVRAAFAGVAAAEPFLADWPDIGPRREVAPVSLPVCRWLEGMTGSGVAEGDEAAGAGEGGAAFGAAVAGALAAIRQAAPGLRWQQTYGAADFGADFLQAYGWCEFIGLRGPLASEKIACGVLLLGPGVTYPAHAHAAEEVYLPIHGVAEWQQGDRPFAPVPVGQAIHHAPWVPHAMRVGAEPLAALYLWRGGDLAAKSVILGK